MMSYGRPVQNYKYLSLRFLLEKDHALFGTFYTPRIYNDESINLKKLYFQILIKKNV